MGMGFAPTWLRQMSPLLHMTTLTTDVVTEFQEESLSGWYGGGKILQIILETVSGLTYWLEALGQIT